MKKPNLKNDIKHINPFTYFAGYSNTVDSDVAVLGSEKE
jgi:hypothetical protein